MTGHRGAALTAELTERYRDVAQRALDVQDACNLSGVSKSFADVTSVLWEVARALGEGTDWVNKHPISYLWVDKMADLAGVPHYGEGTAYGRMLDAVEQIATTGTYEEKS